MNLLNLLTATLILGGLTPSIKRENQTTSAFLTSDVLDDLQSDESFNLSKYPLRENITDDESISGITLVEDNLSSLYFYIYNCNGKNLSEGLSAVRITMSTDATNYDDVSYYDLTVLDYSEDYLFWKFKVDYIFPETYSDERAYCISEIEFDFGAGYSEGQHNTIGQFYLYSGTGDDLDYELKELNVVELDIIPGYYRFNETNGNTVADEKHYWDLFYITFPIRRDYGDLVGIKLTWNEYLTDYQIKQGKETDSSRLIENNLLDIRNTDLLTLDIYLKSDHSISAFLAQIFHLNFVIDEITTDVDIPMIEKIEFDNLSSSSFDGYCFNDETKTALNDSYYRTIGSSDFYVVRFAYRDFCDFILATDFTNYQVRKIKTEIQDCDVLTLTFLEDGKEYKLMASSKPVDIIPSGADILDFSSKSKPKWWERILEAIKKFFASIIAWLQWLLNQSIKVIVIGLLIVIGVIALIYLIGKAIERRK